MHTYSHSKPHVMRGGKPLPHIQPLNYTIGEEYTYPPMHHVTCMHTTWHSSLIKALPCCRVVNQLLTEMDGTDSRGAVFVLAATNRPDMIDPALLRPGRLGKTLYVPLPDSAGRGAIFTALCAKSPIEAAVDAHAFAAARACEGFSGADLASLLREAAVASLKVLIHPHNHSNYG